jgi:hypothetical protein
MRNPPSQLSGNYEEEKKKAKKIKGKEVEEICENYENLVLLYGICLMDTKQKLEL